MYLRRLKTVIGPLRTVLCLRATYKLTVLMACKTVLMLESNLVNSEILSTNLYRVAQSITDREDLRAKLRVVHEVMIEFA